MIKRKIDYINYNKEYQFQKHGNWTDLAISKDYNLKPDEFTIMDLGIAMALPKHYEAIVIPRSSTYKHWRLLQVNSIGLIDDNYCGTGDRWGFPCESKVFVQIPKGTRICQFRIQLSFNAPWYIKLADLFTAFVFNEVDVLPYNDRSGFGSSGK